MNYTIATIAPIYLFPLIAFVIGAFVVKKSEKLAVGLSTISIFLSFIYSFRIFKDFVFGNYATDYYVHKTFTWFDLNSIASNFQVNMGVYIDNMTAVMLLMVTGVATLIHVFSTYYMHDDAKFGKFFVYLSLFTSAMIGLVLSDNLLSIFIFWEIMGFCSYSLIGFYHEKEKAGDASIKAFMTTRVGDVIFLLGILAIWTTVGSVGLTDIYAAIADGAFAGKSIIGISLATFAAFCIFCGTIGKSAQFPLQVWLPDAMMGPTPCSALIHAATMVAAGVYLSLRMYPLMELGGLTTFMAYIGAITAFGAATIALIQTDIKAVLAYSTISQLGYMVMGIGVGSYNAAFMHLITHAVFKACLFLSAGSVIHSLHVQEMPRMGGLKAKLPFTFIAMAACTLAISGIPFFSGFVSKDRILGDALYWGGFHHSQHMLVPILGFSAAFLTAFYMCRMMFLTFFGTPRDKELYDHTHVEKLSWNQNVPLLILSVFTLGVFFSGSLTGQGLIKIFPKQEWFKVLIKQPEVAKFKSYQSSPFMMTDNKVNLNLPEAVYDKNDYGNVTEEQAHHIHSAHVYGAIASIFIAFSGVLLAALMYIRKTFDPGWWVSKFSWWYRALENKYYMDHFYIKILIQKGLIRFNELLARFDLGFYDRYAIDGWEKVNTWIYRVVGWTDNIIVDRIAVDGTGFAVRGFNKILRFVQTGKIQFYFIIIIFVLACYIWALKIN